MPQQHRLGAPRRFRRDRDRGDLAPDPSTRWWHVDYPRRGRHGWRRWVPSWRLVTGSAVAALCCLAGLFAYIYASVGIPDENPAARQQASVYYWSDGTPMVSVGAVNRRSVPLSQVPDSVQHAAIAAENADFYRDRGVSATGMLRAAFNMLRGQETQGGSTITQQYVKNTYLSQQQTVGRKVKELVISLKVSNQRSKADILQGYLNTSWFGRNSYGIQAASYAYYGVPAKRLNPSQGAVLAALLKGAERYDPALSKANHQRAVARWKWILDREVSTGWMSAKQRAKYRTFPEPLRSARPDSQSGQIGYLVDIANKYLASRTGLTAEDIARGGYQIHTTFDRHKVQALAQAVQHVRAQSLHPDKRKADSHVQVGAASVRPQDGAVVAVYGGSDATRHFSDNADTAGVPVGSAFTPFTFAATMERDGAQVPTAPPEQSRAPGADAADGKVTARRSTMSPLRPLHLSPGLYKSVITGDRTGIQEAGIKVGLTRVRDVAVASGLRKESMATLDKSFPLGTSTPSAVRMASAYTTFTGTGKRAGTHVEPYSVTEVLRDGKRLGGLDRPTPHRAVDPLVAEQVDRGMLSTGARTLGKAADEGGGVAAGATSPEDRMRSAWFVGSDRSLSTAVTMFRAEPGAPLLPMDGVGGAGSKLGTVLPPQIWSAYAEAVAPSKGH